MAKMTKEGVLKAIKDNNVKFIRLWFTDILGFLKSFAVTPGEMELAMEEGMGFDGSSIQGFARIDESDMVAMPDPSTFVLLPWRNKEDGAVARMFTDVLNPDLTPYVGDPRYILKRQLKKAADMGLTMYVGPELEFFYFKDSNGTEVLDRGRLLRPDPPGRGQRPQARHHSSSGEAGHHRGVQPPRSGPQPA